MRVRISFDALRLCLLVAAGITSGYLWRAAFESSSPADQRVAAPPRIIQPAPEAPAVHIPRRVAHPARTVRTHRPARTRPAVTPRRASGLISQPVTSAPRPTRHKPKPAPKPPSNPPPTTPPPTGLPAQTPSVAAQTAQVVSSPPAATSPPPPTPTPTPTPQPPPQPPPHGDDEDSHSGGHHDDGHDHHGGGGDDHHH
jgi:hypothetical protein